MSCLWLEYKFDVIFCSSAVAEFHQINSASGLEVAVVPALSLVWQCCVALGRAWHRAQGGQMVLRVI